MVTIKLITSDSKIWNKDSVLTQIVEAMCQDRDIVLDLINEGPCFESLGLVGIINDLKQRIGYNKTTSVLTCNLAQKNIAGFRMIVDPPMHFVTATRDSLGDMNVTKSSQKKFGLFIGRSNHHRLDIASYLWKNYQNQIDLTYHFDINVDYHTHNIGIEDLGRNKNMQDLRTAAEFLFHCPIKQESTTYPMLMDQHCNIWPRYQNFFVEIVCETFFTGDTFCPTEKIWRPIMLCTPFIVQGPRYFLHRIRDLGFKTFDRWWDEGYSEDPADWQTEEIRRVIDYIASKDKTTIDAWADHMRDTLIHNRQRLLALSVSELLSIYPNCEKYA